MEENTQTPSLIARLEALLFVYGELLSIKKAAEVLGVKKEEISEAAKQLSDALATRGSGLTVMVHDDSLQLATRPEHAALLQAVIKAELNESLTPASLETLAIITYAGPIARAEIDYIRGVNSSYTLRALALRGLVDRETDPQRANVYLYRPSADLVRHLGITKLEELPDYQRLRGVAEKIKQPASSVNQVTPIAAPAPEAPQASTEAAPTQ
jgi:segregation and condensation protein B